MLYERIIRPLLFILSPERAHNFTLGCLSFLRSIPLGRQMTRLFFSKKAPSLNREVFGIDFPNPIGLAGGLDKNGEHYNSLSDLGFAFVEIGSLTTEAQKGNPSPRLWRLPKDQALVNHMGINNKGIINAIEHIREDRPRCILVGNISKRTTAKTEGEIKADYIKAFSLIYDFVDMVVVNVSCPNVEGLTSLQDVSYLSSFMDPILDRRMIQEERKPVLVKISPDLENEQVDAIIEYCRRNGVDGLVAGNTTRKRENLSTPPQKLAEVGSGGLSGAPLYERSLSLVKYIHEKTGGSLPVIGCGGIMTPAQAMEMLDSGASLVEVYTGFIYHGPSFVKKILRAILKRQKEEAAALKGSTRRPERRIKRDPSPTVEETPSTDAGRLPEPVAPSIPAAPAQTPEEGNQN